MRNALLELFVKSRSLYTMRADWMHKWVTLIRKLCWRPQQLRFKPLQVKKSKQLYAWKCWQVTLQLRRNAIAELFGGNPQEDFVWSCPDKMLMPKMYFLSVQAVVLDAHCFLSKKCYTALGLEELSCKTCDNGFAFCTSISYCKIDRTIFFNLSNISQK